MEKTHVVGFVKHVWPIVVYEGLLYAFHKHFGLEGGSFY